MTVGRTDYSNPAERMPSYFLGYFPPNGRTGKAIFSRDPPGDVKSEMLSAAREAVKKHQAENEIGLRYVFVRFFSDGIIKTSIREKN